VPARRRLGLAAAALALPPPARAASPARDEAADGAADSIGDAAMLADGTIVMDLRATLGGSGLVGDARLTFPPDHPRYAAVRAHLPGLRPGGSVLVPPFR